MRLPRAGVALGAAVGVLSLLAPLVLGPALLTLYVLLGLAAVVTTGVSLLMGYAGQVSLGQAAFYAVGAYTAAVMALHGLPPLLALVCAPVVAGVLALAVGVPLLRLRGHYLAFATLAFQLILLAVVGQQSFLGGDIGLQGIPTLGIGPVRVASPVSFAWLTWAAVAATLLLTRNVISSRPGRGLRALATSETAAASAGVPVGRYRLVVFALSAALAGLAGGIYAFFLGYISPGSFPILLSFEYVVMAVVGGLGTVWGALVGSAVITVLVDVLNALGTRPGMPASAASVFSYGVYALLLIVVLLFLPAGLLPSAAGWLRRHARPGGQPAPPPAAGPASHPSPAQAGATGQ